MWWAAMIALMIYWKARAARIRLICISLYSSRRNGLSKAHSWRQARLSGSKPCAPCDGFALHCQPCRA